jgi:hypothetical protein
MNKYREDDTQGATEGDTVDPDATVRPMSDVSAAMGTMVRRATNRSPRSPSATSGGHDGTFIRQLPRATADRPDLGAEGTLARSNSRVSAGGAGPVRHRKGSSSGDAQTGTLVRHQRPASRRPSADNIGDGLDIVGETERELEAGEGGRSLESLKLLIGATGTTNFTGTSNKAEENPGLQSALRYFQNLGGGAPPSTAAATATSTAVPPPPQPQAGEICGGIGEGTTRRGSTTAVSTSLAEPEEPALSLSAITLDEKAPPLSYHERKLRELVRSHP